jgi:tetratricopeptide (TPR) repeat protein
MSARTPPRFARSMPSFTSCLSALALAAACGGTQPAATQPQPQPTGTTTVTVAPPDAGLVSPPDAGAQASTEPLPPPKPTTIRLASRAGDAVDQELDRGDAAFEKDALDEARAHYEAAKKLGPKRAGPLVGLARVRIAKSKAQLDYGAAKGNTEVAAAVRELKTALGKEKDYGPAYAELGRAQLMEGDGAAALASLRRGAELLPDEPEAQSALGVALLATGQKSEALAALERATHLDPGSAPRHGNLGTVLLLVGRVDDAVKEFELQARLAGDDARAHSDLGTALLAKNDLTRAVSELERAVALDSSRPSYLTNLGYAYQLLGRRADAIARYRAALRIDDKFASAWIDLATALAQDPKTRAEARAALMTAKRIDPSDPRVKANLEELDALEKKKR